MLFSLGTSSDDPEARARAALQVQEDRHAYLSRALETRERRDQQTQARRDRGTGRGRHQTPSRVWRRALALRHIVSVQYRSVLADCLIAVVALRGELAVLHADRDFDALARRCGLRTQQAP